AIRGSRSSVGSTGCLQREGEVVSPTDPMVCARFAEIRWSYADRDQEALAELRRRLAATGRREGLIDYSALVRGVAFCIPTVTGGQPCTIDTHDWQDLDRDLLGDFLGA